MRQVVGIMAAFLVMIGASCGSGGQGTPGETTQVITFEGETISLGIPGTYERANRLRLQAKVPFLDKEKPMLRAIESTMEGFRFEDEAVDAFVDTNKPLSVLTFSTTKDFVLGDKYSGVSIHKAVEEYFIDMKQLSFGMKPSRADYKVRQDKRRQLYSFSYKIDNAIRDNHFYQTIHFLVDNYQTIVAIEHSLDNESIMGSYLWPEENAGEPKQVAKEK